jgi:hypothetical protein
MNFCLIAAIAALGGLLSGNDTRVISLALLSPMRAEIC